jgi:hypothetical protein
MKIIKRGWMSRPISTLNLWMIPLVFYIIQKYAGVIRPYREWMWWVLIPTLFSVWFVYNFKIIKSK